jgi:hypothetical protein
MVKISIGGQGLGLSGIQLLAEVNFIRYFEE